MKKMIVKNIPPTVVSLGVVSFFTDLSSEMIYPLLPLFLANTLGASVLALGAIEGLAETTASVVKLISGFGADRTERRKPWVVAGYSLAGFARPLISLAQTWPQVMGIRFADRVGKGIRTAPRDAMIADATELPSRATAYGFHRSMDHAGAVTGPLCASALLLIPGISLRMVFALAVIPALVGIIFLLRTPEAARSAGEAPNSPERKLRVRELARVKGFPLYLLSVAIFSLGNSTDAFLLLALANAKIPAIGIAVLWSLHHVVKMVATFYGGKLGDRYGYRRLMLGGWAYYGFIYLLFAVSHGPVALAAIFLAYGFYYGFVEPSEKALVAQMVPPTLRGSAFGLFHLSVGLTALPASVLFGAIAARWGMAYGFYAGAGLAVVAASVLAVSGQLP